MDVVMFTQERWRALLWRTIFTSFTDLSDWCTNKCILHSNYLTPFKLQNIHKNGMWHSKVWPYINIYNFFFLIYICSNILWNEKHCKPRGKIQLFLFFSIHWGTCGTWVTFQRFDLKLYINILILYTIAKSKHYMCIWVSAQNFILFFFAKNWFQFIDYP